MDTQENSAYYITGNTYGAETSFSRFLGYVVCRLLDRGYADSRDIVRFAHEVYPYTDTEDWDTIVSWYGYSFGLDNMSCAYKSRHEIRDIVNAIKAESK